MAKHLNTRAKEAKPKLAKSLKKSYCTSQAKKSKIKVPTLNPMNFYLRFPHVTEKIFNHSDKKSLLIVATRSISLYVSKT